MKYITSNGKKNITEFKEKHKIYVGNLFEGEKADDIKSILNEWLKQCKDQVRGEKNQKDAYLVLKKEYVYIGKRRENSISGEIYESFEDLTIILTTLIEKLEEAKKEQEAKKKQEEANKAEKENKTTGTKVGIGPIKENNKLQAFTSLDYDQNQANAFASSDISVNVKNNNNDIESNYNENGVNAENDSEKNNKKGIEDNNNEKAFPAKENEEDKNYDIDILFVPTYQRDKISIGDSLIDQHIIHWSEEKEEEELKHNPYPCLPIDDDGQVKFVYFNKNNKLDDNLTKELNKVVNELFDHSDWENDRGIKFKTILSKFKNEEQQQIKNHFAEHFNSCIKSLDKKTVAWKDRNGKHHFQFGEGEDSPKGFFVPYGKEEDNEYIYIQWEGGELKKECKVFTCKDLNNPAQSCMTATNETITLKQDGNEYSCDNKVTINATSLTQEKSNYQINNASFDSVVQEESNDNVTENSEESNLNEKDDLQDLRKKKIIPNNNITKAEATLAGKQKGTVYI